MEKGDQPASIMQIEHQDRIPSQKPNPTGDDPTNLCVIMPYLESYLINLSLGTSRLLDGGNLTLMFWQLEILALWAVGVSFVTLKVTLFSALLNISAMAPTRRLRLLDYN
ncbi:hypothetical protein ACH5RR_023247 [Cinchona calisaya]|uniref:Uncharacterized protein n=1 Tax=Cinchona calisaya TaxID=153742 RepID=A0ABD2ZDK2_9GENT